MKELIATHRMPLTRFVLGLTRGQHHTAEDIVQEKMIRAWRIPIGTVRSRQHYAIQALLG